MRALCKTIAVAVVMALVPAAARAQAQASPSPVALMAFFQGCWRGAFEGQTGVIDERCFTPILNGRAMRDAHVVRGGPVPYEGESIYVFDPERGEIVYSYFASDGGASRGVVRREDDALVFPSDRYVGADGTVMSFRARWVERGPNAYEAITEAETDGVWREVMRIRFTRAPDTHAR